MKLFLTASPLIPPFQTIEYLLWTLNKPSLYQEKSACDHKEISPYTYMENAVAIENPELLAAQQSLNASPVDVESIYNSFCEIIDEQLETKTITISPLGPIAP